MSQAKVDRYKEEKKNRAKIMKRKKIKKAIAVLIAALGIGAIIGIPLGKYVYNKQKEAEKAKATISSLEYMNWFDKYWASEYGDMFASTKNDLDVATASDADAASTDDAIEIDAGDINVDEGTSVEIEE